MTKRSGEVFFLFAFVFVGWVFSEKAKEKELERKTTFHKSEKSKSEPIDTRKEKEKQVGEVKQISAEASVETRKEQQGKRDDLLVNSPKSDSLGCYFQTIKLSLVPFEFLPGVILVHYIIKWLCNIVF